VYWHIKPQKNSSTFIFNDVLNKKVKTLNTTPLLQKPRQTYGSYLDVAISKEKNPLGSNIPSRSDSIQSTSQDDSTNTNEEEYLGHNFKLNTEFEGLMAPIHSSRKNYEQGSIMQQRYTLRDGYH
jgi:hypothetical protein